MSCVRTLATARGNVRMRLKVGRTMETRGGMAEGLSPAAAARKPNWNESAKYA
jgi:hypothetical protein